MLNIALIGCGRIGRMHGALVHAHRDARLAVVHDPVAAAAQALAAETGATVADSAGAVFADPGVDAVIVASVTATHADYIEQAVAAGKPVLCEKPIDLDIRRVEACRTAIAGTDVPVQIGFNRRFDPGHQALRAAVAAGEVGRLVQLLVTSRDPEPPSDEYLLGAGGMIRDMTIHDFDLARYVLGGDEVVEVFAHAGALIDPERGARLDEVDCAMILMRTASGAQVLINNARQAPYGYDQRLEAVGPQGMLQSTNRTPHGLTRFTADATAAGAGYEPFFIERYAQAFRAQLDSFLQTARTGGDAEVGFEDGRRALLLAEAAYASLQQGRAVAVEAAP
ncbi:inositol 2-dehydrogenase [Rhodobacteraceae bacterium 2CG4]|uniref:Inositol 2-dehydrogenase n=1 Tax=Halovulum marinum TaxID=2662447 RepID=A0A6L5Z498_9RHOB|nr:inositol 2-dehydrogenase [Halovulum marinum]